VGVGRGTRRAAADDAKQRCRDAAIRIEEQHPEERDGDPATTYAAEDRAPPNAKKRPGRSRRSAETKARAIDPETTSTLNRGSPENATELTRSPRIAAVVRAPT